MCVRERESMCVHACAWERASTPLQFVLESVFGRGREKVSVWERTRGVVDMYLRHRETVCV